MSDDLIDKLKAGSAIAASAYVPPPELLRVAKGIVDGVMSGQITSLACIAAGPGGQIQCPFVGELPLINLGVDLMKGEVMAAIRSPQRSRLLRPHN